LSQITKTLTSGGPIPPNIPTSFLLDDGNSAVPTANVIQVHGVGSTTSIGASNEIVITVINDGFVWTDEAVTFNALPQNGYFCTGTITANLPSSVGLANGATIIIYVDSASVVTVQANAGQTIQLSNTQSVVAGNVTSNSEGSTITLVYRISDSEWHSLSVEGTWTVN